ncbi:conserved hypothetical protein [Nostocoides japonicum T1-X7]|uniref:Uncharacterized protein n=1 Tax=Nostocoides japonicum T1-X7 TaxID=1194083 RepID=A0A077LV99_9MICO|nr:peptidase C39 family protein [Tetrasphaera japonica]CCH76667.1 conserved hypothetical protein [Tetrasphaera japonica T1-X7]
MRSPAGMPLDDPEVAAMVAALDTVRQAHWRRDRSPYTPQVFRVSEAEVTVWMLVSRRPHTAAHKIADVVITSAGGPDSAPDPDAVCGALGQAFAVVVAAHSDDAATRLEVHPWLVRSLPDLSNLLRHNGFVVSRSPLASIPSTTGDVTGWVRWAAPLRPDSVEVPPFMGQTTDFTCGAVSLITAIHRPGRSVLSDPADRASNRRDELRWWRKATNMPACDPLTLALADAEALGPGTPAPTVYLTGTGPILLEDYDGLERDRRATLQDLSRQEAEALGIEIRPDWPGPSALADLVEHGHAVQLLIDEVPMHAEEIPHWITAFAVTTTASGQRVLVVQDPWVDADHGETWVDADQLPITLDDIDLMARFGTPSYRSAIVLTR